MHTTSKLSIIAAAASLLAALPAFGAAGPESVFRKGIVLVFLFVFKASVAADADAL
jgi:hypothetical protein